MNKLITTNRIRPVGRKAMLFVVTELLFVWVLNGAKPILGSTLAIITAANMGVFVLVYGAFWSFSRSKEIPDPITRLIAQAWLIFCSIFVLFVGAGLVNDLLHRH